MFATHVFHKITLDGRRSKYSAWFFGDPTDRAPSLSRLIDAERIDSAGRSYPVTAAERAQLERGPWTARQVQTFQTPT